MYTKKDVFLLIVRPFLQHEIDTCTKSSFEGRIVTNGLGQYSCLSLTLYLVTNINGVGLVLK